MENNFISDFTGRAIANSCDYKKPSMGPVDMWDPFVVTTVYADV